MIGPEDEDIYADDFIDEIDDELEDDECGLMPDGQCMLAGTEHCDFSCGWRDSEFFAGSEAWRRKRARKPKRS